MMTEQTIDQSDPYTDLLGRVIEWLLAAVLVFGPLAFGTSDPWSEQVVLSLIGAMLALFLLRLIVSKTARFVWSWAYLPVAVFVLIAALQLIPLPASMVKAVSPNTFAIKAELLTGLRLSELNLSSMTLSFYPHATRHDLRLVLGVVGVFVIVINCYRSRTAIKRLLMVIAATGGLVAVVAIGQFVAQTDKIYGIVPSGHGLADAGPFVNHSNFAQFMNLSIGAAIALLFVRVRETFSGHTQLTAVFDELGSRRSLSIWVLFSLIVLGIIAVFVSLSRGGIVSMLLAAAVIVCLITFGTSHRGRGQLIAITVLLAFACVLYIGFDAVYQRMATLHDLDGASGGRWQMLKDISAAWLLFPFLGTGLGTYQVVYPMFDSSTIASLAGHAENEYAQAMAEMGLIGLLALMTFGALVGIAFLRNSRRFKMPLDVANYGLGFGLTAVLVHSFSDFGQHLPANAILTATFCALILNIKRSGGHPSPDSKMTPSADYSPLRARWCAPTLMKIGILSIFMLGWIPLLIGANQARMAESHWQKALDVEEHLASLDWQGTDAQFVELLRETQDAVACDPDRVDLRHWLNIYRWQSISRIADPNTGQVLILPETVEYTKRIVNELKQAILLCPTYGPAYSLLGELETLVLGDPNGPDHVQTGYTLAPCHAATCFVAGSFDALQGKTQEAYAKLQRAVALDGNYFAEAVTSCLRDLNDPNLALQLAGDNIARLGQVATLLTQWDGGETSQSKLALSKAREQLVSRSLQPDAPAGVFASLATVYTKENEPDLAAEYYQKALVLDYGQIGWRCNLARLLDTQGRYNEALHEVRICLRLNSEYQPAKRLIQELAVKAPGPTSLEVD
ncbi:MAG: O-antigen ligase family protein [Planctomycetes bacterium]|nr:O-antigen ligase family protein [Planctomycetota bacterium]